MFHVPSGTPRGSLPTLPFFPVTFQASPPLLCAGATRPLTFAEVMETLEVLLVHAAHHCCPYWMVDRRIGPSEEPAELHRWVQEDYFPRVRAVLGQPPQVAFLVTPAELAQLQEYRATSPQDWHTPAVYFGWFTQPPAAAAWLQAQRVLGPPNGS